MKKSKFLLLGSVASLASIPFVAAKCGETKEEKKRSLKHLKGTEHLKTKHKGPEAPKGPRT
nr:variable surface lipoprotein [Mycoplasmopsis bovis]